MAAPARAVRDDLIRKMNNVDVLQVLVAFCHEVLDLAFLQEIRAIRCNAKLKAPCIFTRSARPDHSLPSFPHLSEPRHLKDVIDGVAMCRNPPFHEQIKFCVLVLDQM